MASIDYPCERCGFDTGNPESGRHFDELYCYRAVYLAAVETMKEKVAKAAEAIGDSYGANGAPEADRFAEAFRAFAEAVRDLPPPQRPYYHVRIFMLANAGPLETHSLGQLSEDDARKTAYRYLPRIFGTTGRIELFDMDPDDPDEDIKKPIAVWKA